MFSKYEIVSVIEKTYKLSIFKIKYKDKLYCIKSYTTKHYNAYNEINILSSLHHQNIIKYYDYNDNNNIVDLILEYCPYNDLSYILHIRKVFDEFFVLYKIIKPLIKALEYIHTRYIIHCDIKPENILIAKDNTIRLCDFENAIDISKKTPNKYCGTVEYMAPEMIQLGLMSFEEYHIVKSKNHHMYDTKVDIWGLGILLYELMYGKTPFFAENENNIKNNIIIKDIVYIKNNNISDECILFLKYILNKNVINRPNIHEVLVHEWITKQNKYNIRSISMPDLHNM